jgi:hypothetical protein
MAESKDIQWKRIAAEGVAIVASILLAFWIDAWWDDRQNRAEERELLVGLEAEFVDLRARLDRWGKFNRESMILTEKFLSDSMTEMDVETVELLFSYVWVANVLDVGGALDALLASGRLERISDREIRLRLAKWPDWLEDIHTNDLSIRRYAWSSVIPFLTDHGIPRRVCPEWVMSCPEPGPLPADFIELAADPEFRAILTIRRTMMWFTATDYENAREEADAILTLIRAHLAKSGTTRNGRGVLDREP